MAVKKFVVAGGSKRGWTTWLTGAVDRRVVAIVPIVIDVVNVRACSINHFLRRTASGPRPSATTPGTRFWTGEIPRNTRALIRIEDPYFYRDRLTMPKYVVNAAGDQYFPPDSSKFYFGDLSGPKYLRYVPNADHSLRGSDAADSILAFYWAILKKKVLPQFPGRWQPTARSGTAEASRARSTCGRRRTPRPAISGWRPSARRTQKLVAEPENDAYVAKVPKPEADGRRSSSSWCTTAAGRRRSSSRRR